MRNRKTKTGNRRGVVLIWTFIMLTALTAIVVAFLSMTSIQTKAGGYDIAGHQALWLAEAGLQQALYTLKNDVTYQNSPVVLSSSLGAGAYSVTAGKDGSTYTFTSTGTVLGIQRQIRTSAVLSSTVLERGIHADGSNVDFTGSSGVINGNVSCCAQVKNYSGMTINGEVTEGYPAVNPSVDFDYYKSLAQAAGQFISGSYTFQNGTYTGVWYVTVEAAIGNNAVIAGSIFSDGNIRFANQAANVQITPPPLTNYPALAAKGNISTSATGAPGQRVGLQNSVLNGLILARDNIVFDDVKDSAVNGAMLAVGNLFMKNGSGIAITYDEDIFAPMPAGFTYTDNPRITLQNDWEEI